MKTKSYGIGLAAAALLATTVGAWASKSPEMFMRAVNKDADKTISLKEVDAHAMRRFEDLDSESKMDGLLTKDELGGRMTAAEFAVANTKHSKFRA